MRREEEKVEHQASRKSNPNVFRDEIIARRWHCVGRLSVRFLLLVLVVGLIVCVRRVAEQVV